MKLRIGKPTFVLQDLALRIPFRFGRVTLTRAQLLTLRVRIETEAGASAEGAAADLLVPKWFDKDPAKTSEENATDLVASARRAAAAFADRDAPPAPLFESWWRVYQRCVGRTPAPGRALVDGFGVALVERAAMDALCRAAGLSFFTALQRDLFGFRPGRVHRELDGFDLAGSLPPAPRREVTVRHTIGLADQLHAADLTPETRVDDGFPQALEEDLARYGLTCFKVKLGGDVSEDRTRLLALARFFAVRVPELGRPPPGLHAAGDLGTAFAFTVDGNEQYRDLDALVRLFDEVARETDGARLLRHLLLVEQPLARATSFDPAQRAPLARISARAPVILDEADFGVDAFPQAIELGYRGISVKNCKGVFRSLLNSALVRARNAAGARNLFQTAEDLTNVPLLPLQQDLATIAALDLPHAERNGHHYFRGLRHLPEAEARAALQAHPDLYEEDAAGIRLKIRAGKLALASLQCPGYGCAVPLTSARA